MHTHKDWSSIPSPGHIAAGLAFGTALAAATDLPPRYTPEPRRAVHDDGGGSSFVLDLTGAAPVLVTRDHDEREVLLTYEDIRAALGLSELPGPFAHERDAVFSGAARWDGSAWTSAVGVPGRVVTHTVDDRHLLTEADIALGEIADGESDPDALAALLASVRAGTWDRDTVAAAVRLSPYEDDEELDAEPDPDAALEALELYAPLLDNAAGRDRGTPPPDGR
ncbi:hypothetical protein ABZ023_21375 [Streptomyces sp. NPDC006367]|uniref:hypothetical protein n=1 Tax=unclassified Streptomyces TaxID=2593676 RepID=UPI0033A53D9A